MQTSTPARNGQKLLIADTLPLKVKNRSVITSYSIHYTKLYEDSLAAVIEAESSLLAEQMGHLAAGVVERVSGRLEKLKDIAWCLRVDILSNVKKIRDLLIQSPAVPSMLTLSVFSYNFV